MHVSRREAVFHRLLTLGIWLKGLDGLLEIIGGLLLLGTTNVALNRAVIVLTQHELAEDPQDWLAVALRHAAAQLSLNSRLLGSAYLLAHGVIKIILMIAVVREYRKAFPWAIAFLCLLITYQLYRLLRQPSIGLAALTLFDLVVVGLLWHEQRRLPVV